MAVIIKNVLNVWNDLCRNLNFLRIYSVSSYQYKVSIETRAID
jgi:hypothetical protein